VAKQNKLTKIVSNINKLPDFMRSKALTTLFGKTVKYTGTTGQKVELLEKQSFSNYLKEQEVGTKSHWICSRSC